MTSPFRSISRVAPRRRVRPVVERATFVVVSQGAARYAFPVESVERVLRPSAHASLDGTASIAYATSTLVRRDLASMLSLNQPSAVSREARVLVVRHDLSPHTAAAFSAVSVDDVHEVVAIETALIGPVVPSVDGHDAPRHPAVRACFVHHDAPVWVLDPARLSRDAA